MTWLEGLHEIFAELIKDIMLFQSKIPREKPPIFDWIIGKDYLTPKIEHQYLLDNSSATIEYKYKNGKIWQLIEQMPYKKSVRVYVDGRLIRNRVYMGEDLFAVVDYQYEYF